MSSRRQVDVESPPEDNKGDGVGNVPPATAFAAASSADSFAAPSGVGSSKNPIFLAKAILRKVITLMSSNDEDVTRVGGIVTLLKDIVIGFIIALFYMAAIMFLDHRNIIHVQSAHNFRNAAFQMLNDPETIASIEESSDLKFMTTSDYEAKREAIEGAAVRIKDKEEEMKIKAAKAEEVHKELEAAKAEYEKLMASPMLDITKYCETCTWAGKTTCGQRVQFMMDTYNMGKIASMNSAMEVATCKKS